VIGRITPLFRVGLLDGPEIQRGDHVADEACQTIFGDPVGQRRLTMEPAESVE
jgi:hypothetical protein